MAKTTETIGEFVMNMLSAEQYTQALKNGEIDPNQLYFTPEKKLVIAVSQDEYDTMKEAGTLDEDVIYVTPASESVTISEATETTAGLMPPASVTKLKNVEDNANNYTHPEHTAYASGFYKVTVDKLGHVTGCTKVTSDDISNLGFSKVSVDSALSSSSTNPVQNKLIYAALPWEYTATFYASSWSSASSDEQALGFMYKQTVTPTKRNSAAPTITANSMFCGAGQIASGSSVSDNVDQITLRDMINGGLVYTAYNSFTALVEEKPTSDVTLSYWLRT